MSLLRSRALLAAGMSASLLACLAVADSSGATSPEMAALEILPPDEMWGGATRGEWDARSVQRAFSMPEDVGPYSDTTGARCGYGQFGPVFFLAGSLGNGEEITCVVAEGTAIYVSPIGAVCSTVGESRFFGRSEDELRACTARELDGSSDGYHQYRVNGQEVADLDTYRIASPLFSFTLPENNIFGVEPGVAQAVSESYSFIVAPPPPGEYEITFSTLASGQAEGTFIVIVETPRVIEPSTT